MRSWIFLVMAFTAAAAYSADESQVQLKAGPGADLVRNNCMTCHSLDYIQMNSPFLDHKGWEAEVNKMINAYHAPIDKANVAMIVDYLAQHYGAASTATPGSSAPGGR